MNKQVNQLRIKGWIVGVLYALCVICPWIIQSGVSFLFKVFSAIFLIVFNLTASKAALNRLKHIQLSKGYYLLRAFSSFLVVYIGVVWLNVTHLLSMNRWSIAAFIIWSLGWGAVLFWNGMIRIFTTSVQLGIRSRTVGTILGMIPILNLIMMFWWLHLVHDELIFEGDIEREYEVCSRNECETQYPILLVHGVFFRDTKLMNYWGRIPHHLIQKGARIYYGNQESAQSVEESALSLKKRIHEVLEESECDKVNIIAHSKGGLDARYAISCLEMSPYVASLTTINTPHNGCRYAEVILDHAPNKFVSGVAHIYDMIFKRLGDKNPDFVSSVIDLTESRCLSLRKIMVDSDDVYYQTVMSCLTNRYSARFPLSFVYDLAKHYDRENDGLVSIESGLAFQNPTLIRPTTRRGISHADMIDLHRENIKGFDVRRFYEGLIVSLKQKGY
ncbi:hypothetical protein AOC36_03710 [Erysipelothrix larvae]|uniref:DUF676 domain-containing protein n=1 Tax=Erysipelothrix larvae TaxID=1514105 RepID=A0A0X8GZ84_9FIRM|nr:hypothetical protein [Erysipelothrix larvae]AMC93110.1 hypothetical protein AOC36_03710 [Erysipelothrix larvae]